ncbi:CDP-diacylglycerol-serine O-phosphatidyltransferase [Verticillium dahliae VdLs.17]|uniref:CDP-diacylglycerol-serine O-phosphatidyltransferase n=1 Tax=Verticillium dahliae (strain VdLs.17 / ATCC MYA-4575 / FGSC 10137) TaxID=498257 RepID=G2XH16_VERDV|nr:CDP-diacylglycerol-serine O-phosphatidyltransferase [Verticillium dahliae VdLs.17]EGY19114.1 CDP-diacylglycerol-serine O-phosphatidyltransferase [Verticillium dahliae VdLs.17]
MSKRTSSAVTNGSLKEGGDVSTPAQDKQKLLLSSETGHFSLIRAMHLADLITLCNGTLPRLLANSAGDLSFPRKPCSLTCHRRLRNTLHLHLPQLLPRRPGRPLDHVPRPLLPAVRPLLRLYGRQGGALAQKVVPHGPGARLARRPHLVRRRPRRPPAYALGLRTPLDRLLLTFFVLCGLTRLARFNVTVAVLPKDASGKSQYFEGTPIPTSLATDSVMAYWIYTGAVLDKLPLGTLFAGSLLEFHPVALLFVVHGCLMTSRRIRIPKP